MALSELALTLLSSGSLAASALYYIHNINRSRELQAEANEAQEDFSEYDIGPENIEDNEDIKKSLDLEEVPPEKQEIVEKVIYAHLIHSVINAEDNEDLNRSFSRLLRRIREQNATELNISSEDLDQLSLEEISERKQSDT